MQCKLIEEGKVAPFMVSETKAAQMVAHGIIGKLDVAMRDGSIDQTTVTDMPKSLADAVAAVKAIKKIIKYTESVFGGA